MLIYIDMNLSPGWAGFLRDHGFDAQHWSEVGQATALDHDILSTAAADGAVILTSDLDFGAILAASGGAIPSVIQIRSADLSVKTAGLQIVSAVRQMGLQLAEGALLTVEPDRLRITMLPLT